jgi:hypothetical protein
MVIRGLIGFVFVYVFSASSNLAYLWYGNTLDI